MSNTGYDEIFEIILKGKAPKKIMKKLGLKEKDLLEYMESIVKGDKPKKYFRILAEDEKEMLSTEAYGFLLNMLNIGSIDSIIFEKVIYISMQIYGFTRRKISREMINDVLNMIVFSGKNELSLKDFLEVFINPEGDYEYKEETN